MFIRLDENKLSLAEPTSTQMFGASANTFVIISVTFSLPVSLVRSL
jgi:hypothetical protein